MKDCLRCYLTRLKGPHRQEEDESKHSVRVVGDGRVMRGEERWRTDGESERVLSTSYYVGKDRECWRYACLLIYLTGTEQAEKQKRSYLITLPSHSFIYSYLIHSSKS